MKKIMMAVAMAVVGFCANAALVSWSVDTIYTSDGKENFGENYLAYYLDAATVSQSEVATALANNDFSFLSKGWEADLTDDEGYTEGKSGNIYSANGAVKGYLVVFDAETTADAKFAYVSDVVEKTINSLGANVTIDFTDAAESSMAASNWTAVNVPEPTSGLLLLLGMAGLALRRKQA